MLSFIAAVAIAAAGLDAAAPDTGPDELQRYLAEASENHPLLHQRFEEWQAALERIPQATSLDDPMFSYGQFILSETQRAKVSFSQKFPWFGTLKARGDQAAAEADAAMSRLHAARDAVFYDVKRSYYDYALLAERTKIVGAQAELLEYIEDIVEAKLSFGLATDDEVLRVSITKTELADRRLGLEQMRPALSRALAARIGRVESEVLPWPAPPEVPLAAPEAGVISERIRVANPNLQAIDHRIDALEYQETLARKRGRPEIAIGLDWTAISKPRQINPDRPYPATLNAASRALSTVTGATPLVPRNTLIDSYSIATRNQPFVDSDGGEDNLMIGITVNIPLWRQKIRGGINEARHLQAAAEREQHARYLDLDAAAQMLRYEMEDAARRFWLYGESLLPQAEMTFESLQEKYAAGTAGKSFIDILGAVQQLLDFQIEQAQSLTRWQQAHAELEMLMGGWPEEHTSNADIGVDK